MKIKDTIAMGTGMLSYNKRFKRAGITPRENLLRAYAHEEAPILPSVVMQANFFQANPTMERYCGTTVGKDGFGVTWKFDPITGASMPWGDPLFEDISEWRDKVHFPDLEAIDWAKQADIDMHTDFMGLAMGKGLVVKNKSQIDESKAGFCMVLNGMFERMHALMGFMNALMALVEDPDECFAFFSAMADYKIAYFKKIKQYYPVDIIESHDDYGTANNMFMRPEMWRELIKPNLKRMVDACHELGLVYEQHSDGYIEPIIGDFVEIGVDAWDPVQVVNSHAREYKDKYQDKLTFVGGLDNVGVADLPESTEEEIFAEYRRYTDLLAPGGSFADFPATATQRPVPLLIEEYLRYGVKTYSKV